jgi:hypothetical protein
MRLPVGKEIIKVSLALPNLWHKFKANQALFNWGDGGTDEYKSRDKKRKRPFCPIMRLKSNVLTALAYDGDKKI